MPDNTCATCFWSKRIVDYGDPAAGAAPDESYQCILNDGQHDSGDTCDDHLFIPEPEDDDAEMS